MFELYTTYSDDNYEFLSNIINNIVRRNFNELECNDNSYSLIINIDIYEFITEHNNQSENTYIFDSVIKNINTRLDILENDFTKEIQQINTNMNTTISSDKNVENLKLNLDKFDKDLRETKDLVMLLMMKY